MSLCSRAAGIREFEGGRERTTLLDERARAAPFTRAPSSPRLCEGCIGELVQFEKRRNGSAISCPSCRSELQRIRECAALSSHPVEAPIDQLLSVRREAPPQPGAPVLAAPIVVPPLAVDDSGIIGALVDDRSAVAGDFGSKLTTCVGRGVVWEVTRHSHRF
jgi:hypothetical protein